MIFLIFTYGEFNLLKRSIRSVLFNPSVFMCFSSDALFVTYFSCLRDFAISFAFVRRVFKLALVVLNLFMIVFLSSCWRPIELIYSVSDFRSSARALMLRLFFIFLASFRSAFTFALTDVIFAMI